MVQMRGAARPGGRTARTRELVHGGVRQLLSDPAAGSPTVAAVAARSGVNTVTIYRRWGTIEALVLDVAVANVNQQSPLEATGDLKSDLLTWAHALVGSIGQPAGLGLFRAIMAAASTPHPGGNDLNHLRQLMQPRLDQFQLILDASSTTEITPTDLVDLVLAPIYIATLFTPAGQTTLTIDVERLTDNVLAVRDHRRSTALA